MIVTFSLQQLKELEEEWGKLPGVPPIPPRRLRSEQDAPIEVPVPSGGGDEDGVEDEGSGGAALLAQAALDPYDLADPEDILGKMPKNFYEKLVRACCDLPVFPRRLESRLPQICE